MRFVLSVLQGRILTTNRLSQNWPQTETYTLRYPIKAVPGLVRGLEPVFHISKAKELALGLESRFQSGSDTLLVGKQEPLTSGVEAGLSRTTRLTKTVWRQRRRRKTDDVFRRCCCSCGWLVGPAGQASGYEDRDVYSDITTWRYAGSVSFCRRFAI